MNNARLECSPSGDLRLGDELLVFYYPAGDIDTIPWPLKCEFRGEDHLE